MIYIDIPGYAPELNRALKSMQDRYKVELGLAYRNSAFPKMDEAFEKENRCKFGYDRKFTPIVVMFEEEDWFWFKAKWS